jgi:zinc and cadmium transporter
VACVSGLPLVVTLVLAQREALIRRVLPQLTAFGAGAVLGAAAGHLIPDALRAGQSPLLVMTGATIGFCLFWLIERALKGHDHAHAHGVALGAPSAHDSDSSEADCVHLMATPERASYVVAQRTTIVSMTLIGDTIHNLVDGMLIAAGFLANPSVGMLTVIAVGLHELPREVGSFSLFVHGGVRPMRAVAYNALTGVVALVGAMATLLVGSQVAGLAMYLLPVAAGTYLYIAQVVGRASLRDRPHGEPHWARLGWAAVGLSLMLGSAFAG